MAVAAPMQSRTWLNFSIAETACTFFAASTHSSCFFLLGLSTLTTPTLSPPQLYLLPDIKAPNFEDVSNRVMMTKSMNNARREINLKTSNKKASRNNRRYATVMYERGDRRRKKKKNGAPLSLRLSPHAQNQADWTVRRETWGKFGVPAMALVLSTKCLLRTEAYKRNGGK